MPTSKVDHSLSVETVSDPRVREVRLFRGRRATAAVVALGLGLSAISVIPFFFMARYPDGSHGWRMRMPYTHDMFLHYDQMRSFYVGLKAGEWYPRWEADTNHGFGAPTTIFYPPGIYYLTSLCHLVASDWTLTLLLAHILMMLLSGAGLYLYARRSLSRASSALAMALYIILPYHLTDQYQREALAELLGFVWMPFVLLFLDCLVCPGPGAAEADPSLPVASEIQPRARSRSTGGNRALATVGLAVSYGGFVWSHPPTAYQFALILAVLIPLLAIIRQDFKGLVLSGLGIMLALGLSAAYLYPATVEKGLINSQFIAENWPYHESYVFMRTQYMLDHWAFFSMIERLWCLNLAVVAVCFAAAVIAAKKWNALDRRTAQNAVLWLVAGLLASFMMTRWSYPISSRIPMIDIGVFSWRMLSITTLAAALLAGAAAERAVAAVRSGRRALAMSLKTAVAVAVVVCVGLTARKVIAPTYVQDVFVPETEHINYAMMPSSVDSEPEDLPDDGAVELDNDNGVAVVKVWEPEHRLIHVELEERDSLFLPTFNYPGWTARLDGKPLPISSSDDLDQIEVELPSGVHEIAFDFLDTVDRKRGRNTSVLSVLIAVFITSVSIARSLMLRPKLRASPGVQL